MEQRIDLHGEALMAHMLGDLTAMRVADIGAGGGNASRMLSRLGAVVTGVEPQEEAVTAARALGGGPTYRVGSAEDTGLQEARFDVVFFSFSLHHCDDPDAALAEAHRILAPGGRICAMEPEALGPCHDVGAPIDDETQVLASAQAAMAQLAPRARRTAHFRDKYYCGSGDELIEKMVRVDPSRRVCAATRRGISDAFERLSDVDETGRYLEFYGRIDTLQF
ncbi:MAG: class I SAM-dependent methyltransferase [Pseudomonadota bacterium]